MNNCRARADISSSKPKGGARRGVTSSAICLALALWVAACGGPESEIRKRLSEPELKVFNRGVILSTPCWTCHDLYGEQNKVGPHLKDIIGRRAGTANFGGYSQAMKDSNITWNEENLAAFLIDVSATIPGTTMNSNGPSNPADAAALAFYLSQLSR
jgi:cytochrome c